VTFIERLVDEQPMPPSTAELEPDDLRLESATAATVRGDYLMAAQIAEEVFASGAYDARLLGYLLMGTLMERGPSSLSLLLRAATCAVVEKRLAFKPTRRREVVLDGVLHWFLSHVVRQLELSGQLGDGQRADWELSLRAGDLDQLSAVAERLLPALEALTSRAKSPQPLRRLIDLLRLINQQPASQNAARAESSAVAGIRDAAALSSDPSALPPNPPPANTDPTFVMSATPPPVQSEAEPVLFSPGPTTRECWLPGFASDQTLYASEPLLRLATNIQRFGDLLAQGNHLLAAVIGAELQRELKRFDPSIYLPKLLTPFLSQLAESCDDLEPYFAQRDSLRFQTLTQLFRADPDGFTSVEHPRASSHAERVRRSDGDTDDE